jgi:hypothetical protein
MEPMINAAPRESAILGGLKRALARAALDALAATLISWRIDKNQPIEHPARVKAGKSSSSRPSSEQIASAGISPLGILE